MLAATLVTLIFSVFFWDYGHSDPESNPEYWVLLKVRAGPPLCLPTTEQRSNWLCLHRSILSKRMLPHLDVHTQRQRRRAVSDVRVTWGCLRREAP